MSAASAAAPRRAVSGPLLPALPLPAALALWTALAAPFAWRFRGAAPDDVFITYRYAQNLAAGRGFVFNPGERVFGLTDPGLGAALGIAHLATRVPIPLLGTLATAAALVAVAALLFAAAARRGHAAAAAAAGALVVSSGHLWAGQGSGPLVALALLLLAAALTERGEGSGGGRAAGGDLAAGLAGGLAVAIRPDAALGAAILGLLLLAGRRRFPWRFVAGLAAAVAVAALAAWGAFGTLVPATLLAKRQMAALAAPGRLAMAALFWRRAAAVLALYLGPLWMPVAALGLAGQGALLGGAAGRPGRLLALDGLGTALAYTLLGVPFFTWYLAPAVAALLAGAAFAAGWLLRRLRAAAGRRRPSPALGLVVLLVAAGVLLALASPLAASWQVVARGPRGDWRRAAYTAAGRWLQEHARPDERIVLEEIGIVGFTSERPVLDLVGLVSPSSLPYAAVSDPLGAFLAAPTDYVLFHTFNYRGATRPIVARPWFPRAYALAARLDFPALGGSVFLYRRRPGVPLPPSRPPYRDAGGRISSAP